MPPPHFTPSTAMPAPVAPDLPKALRNLVKDASAKIRAALLSRGSANTTLGPAYQAINALLADPNIPAPTSAGSSGTSSSAAASFSGAQGATSAATKAQIRTYLSQRLNGELMDLFSDEMDQADLTKLSLLAEILWRLSSLLGPACMMLEWWDVLLRPLLKNPATNARAATQARNLVVFSMTASSPSSYQDEPEPTALWPAAPPGTQTMQRKRGEAPYPLSSTEVISAAERSKSRERRVPSGGSSGMPRIGGSNEHFKRFTQRIFDLYTSEASATPIGQREEDDDIAELGSTSGEHGEPGNAESAQLIGTTWKGNLEAILITYGQERPKEFFHHLAESFVEPTARVPILLLLTIFLRLNSIHTYHITSTALPRMLVLSAQLDTSTTSTALCITALVILLPHIPNWIANGGAGGLPSLLAIYARIIDWRRLGVGWEDRCGATEEEDAERRELDEEFGEVERLGKRLASRKDLQWKRLASTFDTVSSSPPDAVQFFTFIYGIFPCNVIRFLRAPIDYLRKAQYDSPFEDTWEDTIDELAVQTRSAPVLRRHVLHPALVTLTAENEVSDKQRWRDHDAADITAECINLFLGTWHDSHEDSQFATVRDRAFSTASAATSDPRSRSASLGAESQDLTKAELRKMLEQTQPTPLLRDSTVLRPGAARQFSPLRIGSGRAMTEASSAAQRSANEADEILSRYTALRWGAPLQSTTTVRTPSGGSEPPASRPTRSATMWGAPQHQPPHTSSGLAFHQPRSGLASAVTTAAHSSAANARSTGAAGKLSETLSTPPSPLSQALRSRTRERSGSMSSVLSLLPSSTDASSVVPRSSHDHPLISSMLKQSSRSTAGSPVLRPVRTEVYTELAYLQRENLLLRNELNFELYLKEQHLRHIGRLHRDRIADTALEAERQNLYHSVRVMRAQLSATLQAQERQRAEVATTKSRHSAWENELNQKLKTYREERKTWMAEGRELRSALEDARATVSMQARQIDETGAELFELRQQVGVDRLKLSKIAEYERKVQQLSLALQTWDDDVRRCEEQRREMELLLSRWEEMQMILQSSDEALEQANDRADANASHVARLEEALEEAQRRIQQLGNSERSVHSAALQLPKSAASPRFVPRSPQTHLRTSETDSATPEATRLRSRVEQLEAEVLELRVRAEASESAQAYARLRQELPVPPPAQEDPVERALSFHEADIQPLDLGAAVATPAAGDASSPDPPAVEAAAEQGEEEAAKPEAANEESQEQA